MIQKVIGIYFPISGIGIGFITGLLPVIINDHSSMRCLQAVGISYAGSGLGAFFFPIVFHSLLNSFGLKGSLLIMGALSFNAIGGALLLSPPAAKSQPRQVQQCPEKMCSTHETKQHQIANGSPEFESSEGKREEQNYPHMKPGDHEADSRQGNGNYEVSYDQNIAEYDCSQHVPSPRQSIKGKLLSRMADDVRLLREPLFFLITLSYVSFILGNVSLLMILPDYVVSLGHTQHTAVLLLSFFSVTDLLGRLLPGCLSYLSISISNKFLYASSIGLMGGLYCLYPVLQSNTNSENSYILLTLLTLCCGFASGCQMILPPVLAAEMLGQKNTAMAFGLCNFICGIFSLSRPFLFSEYELLVKAN
jgi:hypothetical protein